MGTSASKGGTLYVVATPIGHREDITLRALAVLRDVDLVAAEDTRHTGRLLAHYGIRRPLRSLHEHNERERAPELIRRLSDGARIALVSDAGTPLISDPGFRLVRSAHEHGIAVVPIPGPSAVITALSVAGVATDRFVFEGFLPPRDGRRRQRLADLVDEQRTMVFYESSHRIAATLEAMARAFGSDRQAAVAREMTKLFETVRNDSLGNLLRWLGEDPDRERGEFVVIVAGHGRAVDSTLSARDRKLVDILLTVLPLKRAVEVATRVSGASRNRLYEYAVDAAARADDG